MIQVHCTNLDHVELPGDERNASEQVVEVSVDLSHGAAELSDLAAHVVHGGEAAIDVGLGLALQPVQGAHRLRQLAVHDTDLAPHL
jgi:hypothetical protein